MLAPCCRTAFQATLSPTTYTRFFLRFLCPAQSIAAEKQRTTSCRQRPLRDRLSARHSRLRGRCIRHICDRGNARFSAQSTLYIQIRVYKVSNWRFRPNCFLLFHKRRSRCTIFTHASPGKKGNLAGILVAKTAAIGYNGIL